MLNFSLKPETIIFQKNYCYVERYKTPISLIENTIKYRASETSGMMLIGQSGVGKSRLTKGILEKNLSPHNNTKDCKFGIYVEAPGTSMGGFLRKILSALGDPKPNVGDLDEKQSRIITLIKELEVKVVFIDEIQVVLPSSGLLPTSKVVKILKELINNTPSAWILMGSPESADLIEVDTQLKDRFNRVVTIPPFNCKGEDEVIAFMTYLFDILYDFPRKVSYFSCINESMTKDGISYLASVDYDNLLRFCLATNGKARAITNLLMECIEQTSDNKAITLSALSNSWVSRFQNDSTREVNPFKVSITKVKEELIKRGLYA